MMAVTPCELVPKKPRKLKHWRVFNIGDVFNIGGVKLRVKNINKHTLVLVPHAGEDPPTNGDK